MMPALPASSLLLLLATPLLKLSTNGAPLTPSTSRAHPYRPLPHSPASSHHHYRAHSNAPPRHHYSYRPPQPRQRPPSHPPHGGGRRSRLEQHRLHHHHHQSPAGDEPPPRHRHPLEARPQPSRRRRRHGHLFARQQGPPATATASSPPWGRRRRRLLPQPSVTMMEENHGAAERGGYKEPAVAEMKVKVKDPAAKAESGQKEGGNGGAAEQGRQKEGSMAAAETQKEASDLLDIPLAEVRSELEPIMLSRELKFEEKMAKLDEYFEKRPLLVASRMAKIIGTFTRILAVWKLDPRSNTKAGPKTPPPGCDFEPSSEACEVDEESDRQRGRVLREGISSIGVLFIKLAQTAATRPDLIGDEAARALEKLQDRTSPFSDRTAKQIIVEELSGPGAASSGRPLSESLAEIFSEITSAPVAAASLAQVYRATLRQDGRTVAVKVRRPGLVAQVALDSYIVRLILRLYTRAFAGADRDYELLFNEVGSGLLEELDFRRESENAREFAGAHAHIPFLRVPESVRELVTPRVLTLEWVNGRKLTELPVEDQRRMVQMGIDVCFAQLLSTGIIHADPHYGNMLFDEDGKLALLDFGLVTRVTPAQKEAMAASIVHTLDEDWEGLIDDYRTLGLLPTQPAIWSDKNGNPQDGLGPGYWKPVTHTEFVRAFKASLDEEVSPAPGGADASPPPTKRKRTFSEITTRLTELSFQYRFTLPEWMLFIIRSVITLDGFAGRMKPPFNALELAYPHALRRALTPTTKGGRQSLRNLLLTADGDINFERLTALFGENADRKSNEEKGLATGTAAVTGEQAAVSMRSDGFDKGGLAATISDILSSTDGAALRRILYQLNTERALERVLSILSPFQKVDPSRADPLHQLPLLARAALRRQLFGRWIDVLEQKEGKPSPKSEEHSSVGQVENQVEAPLVSRALMPNGGAVVVGATTQHDEKEIGGNKVTTSLNSEDEDEETVHSRERRLKRIRKVITGVHVRRLLMSPRALLTTFLIASVVSFDAIKTAALLIPAAFTTYINNIRRRRNEWKQPAMATT